jgi:hypothetical protein
MNIGIGCVSSRVAEPRSTGLGDCFSSAARYFGTMMMQMIGTFAEFERAMIGERTRAGLVAGASSTPSSRPISSTTFCLAGKPPRRWPASTASVKQQSYASWLSIDTPCCHVRSVNNVLTR